VTQILDSPTFNLIDEPWIPCIRNDGSKDELSLREVLLEAHQLRSLYGESPLIVASLYRLLLAMMYSVYVLPSSRSWQKLWRGGKNDAARVEAYLEKWHERFDLFHPERPFYQWADERVEPKSIDNILHENSSGNNSTLFDHCTKNVLKTFTPSQSARIMLSAQTYGIAGPCNPKLKLYFSNSPWTSGATFLLDGNSLFETLVLNWFQPPKEMQRESQVFWEKDNPYADGREVPQGYPDYLTWPSRKILLMPLQTEDGNVVVKQVTEAPGLKLNKNVLDPMKHYKITTQGGYSSTKFGEAKALWRDSASLFELSQQGKVKAPQVFHWIANLTDDGYLPKDKQYTLLALGMAAGRLDMEINASAGKVHFYRSESFSFPGEYLQKVELVYTLQKRIEIANDIRKKLYGALARMATLILSPTADNEEGHKPDKKDVQNLMDHWESERQYWAALEAPFFQLMRDLPSKGEDAITQWDIVLQETAQTAFDYAAHMAGNDARALRASVRARGQLAGGLKMLFSEI